MRKNCIECGSDFNCGNETADCWCASLPAVLPLTEGAQCLCPDCLQQKIETVTAWDAISATYAEKYRDEIRLKPICEFFLRDFVKSIPENGLICDMGCGPGQVARYIRQEFPHPVCGVDLSPLMIAEAKKINPGIPFEARDIFNMTEKAIYDGIAGMYFIVNFPPAKLALVFQKLHQLLNPGGKLVLSFHMGSDELVRNEDLWDSGKPCNFYFFNPETVKKTLEENGFTVSEVRTRDPYEEIEYASKRAYVYAGKI
jgi:SAM-dependent methyltransferase